MTDILHTHITQGGRIVIPAEYRKRLGLSEGDRVTLAIDEYGIRVSNSKLALAKLRAIAKERGIGKGVVDRFIAGRRKEAEKE